MNAYESMCNITCIVSVVIRSGRGQSIESVHMMIITSQDTLLCMGDFHIMNACSLAPRAQVQIPNFFKQAIGNGVMLNCKDALWWYRYFKLQAAPSMFGIRHNL